MSGADSDSLCWLIVYEMRIPRNGEDDFSKYHRQQTSILNSGAHGLSDSFILLMSAFSPILLIVEAEINRNQPS